MEHQNANFMTNLALLLSFTHKHTFFFTLDQRIKFSCDISDSYLYVSWHGKKIRSEMISEAFVQLLTSKNITTKNLFSSKTLCFCRSGKSLSHNPFNLNRKESEAEERCIFCPCVLNGFFWQWSICAFLGIELKWRLN